jgi:hypothetical protein
MNAVTARPTGGVKSAVAAQHFVQGVLVSGAETTHRSRDLGVDFTTPAIDLDSLVMPRTSMPPLLDVPVAEIIDFLEETGKRLALDDNPHLQKALDLVAETNPLPRRVIENLYRGSAEYFSRMSLESYIEANFGTSEILDGWVERRDRAGQRGKVRAFPPRLIHMLAGNGPGGCMASIAQGAIVKAVNLFKMPSSDPFTCIAVLRTMAEIDPHHPLVRSMSAIYWRGGDENIERSLYRPQFFDKIVAWGGADAINNVIRYLGPGLQLISFDPKSSISMIGPEAFRSDETIAEVAEKAAADVTVFNQDACLASRFLFVEGEREGVERFCEKLLERLAVDRDFASEIAPTVAGGVRDEIEVLAMMDEGFRVFGGFDGRGMVILSDQPVDFHPTNKTANVVHVNSLDDAIRYVNVATQTIGIYPAERKAHLRDRIASGGGQRICRLGTAARHVMGSPHDAMYPLQRYVHWMADDDLEG